jgi:hypothetical protein
MTNATASGTKVVMVKDLVESAIWWLSPTLLDTLRAYIDNGLTAKGTEAYHRPTG